MPNNNPQSAIPPKKEQEGVALVIVLSAIAILSIFLVDLHEHTGTSHAIAISERDRVQAEYLAKSGLNLTRLLVANEPAIRQIVTPMYQVLVGKTPPQIPVWKFADMLLQPFCHYEQAQQSTLAPTLSSAQGLGDLAGTCDINAVAENTKINVNDPLLFDGDPARQNIAMQMYDLMGGYQSPNPYDTLFNKRDGDGLRSSRLDIISALIDWWDTDNTRTVFDPTQNQVSQSGAEDNPYSRFGDGYNPKNAPFDSVEELRLVRGISDDFWATFIEPQPDNPESRNLTVYGSGAINPNDAAPEVLLSRVCSAAQAITLCADLAERAKFTQLVSTARAMVPLPFFTTPQDFLDFLEGKGNDRALYPMLKGFLGEESALLFQPVSLSQEQRQSLSKAFESTANMISIWATGRVGDTQVRIRSVINFDRRWVAPPPNAEVMPGLGIVQYYRVE